jgi:hypothetical protein
MRLIGEYIILPLRRLSNVCLASSRYRIIAEQRIAKITKMDVSNTSIFDHEAQKERPPRGGLSKIVSGVMIRWLRY